MIQNSDKEGAFLTTFYNLKKYCEDSIFRIQRVTDDKNMELLGLLSQNSFKMNQNIEDRVVEAIAIQRKTEIFQNIHQQLATIINNSHKFANLPKENAKAFETILWLLRKFKTTQYLIEARQAIQSAFNSSTLAYFEQFSNINLESIELKFEVQIDKSQISQYISKIQELYMPQAKPQITHQNKANNTLYPSFDNTIYPPNGQFNPGMNPYPVPNLNQAQWLNNQPLINNNSNQNNQNHQNRGLVNDFQQQKQQQYQQPKQQFQQNHSQESDPMLNQSNAFTFNKNKNNLQISIVKGLKKDNIEFYDQIEPALRAAREMFTDDTFPPERSSLTSNVNEFPLSQKIVWRRISEIYKNRKITLCSDEIGPNDIHQGQLGNCYFLSALSVLSEKKSFIKRLFHSKEVTPTGCYSVWLCDSGEWKNVIIDDYVPCIDNGYEIKPCFSKSKGDDIWVLLLEKAFAKLYGNYYNIDGGFQSEALYALTGAPTKYFSEKENGIHPLEQMWLFLTGSLQNHFIVTAASRSESQIISNKNMGIVSNHAYALLDAKEVVLGNGKKEKLIKMRNPWGRHEWKGDWGDNSPNWTHDVKKQLKYESNEGDGIFWISLIDFDTHFESICTCEVHDDYYFSFIRLGENKKQNTFVSQMTTMDDGFVYLTVQQKMKKHFRSNINYDYSFVRCILARLDQNGQVVSLIHGKYKARQNIVIRRHLPKGNYLVMVEVDWVQRFYNEINLTSYSKVKVDFIEKAPSNYNLPLLYERLMKNYILSSGNKKIQMKQFENEGQKLQVAKHSINKFGLVAILYVNNEKEITSYNRLQISKINNMEIFIPANVNSPFIDINVGPGQQKIVLLKAKVLDLNNTSYAYEYSELYKLVQTFSVEQLKMLCRTKGQRTQTFKNGQIEAYTFKYLGGFADYYVNKGGAGTLQEEITFDAQNILINGQETKHLEIFVVPGQDFLVDMKIKNVFETCRCNRKTRSIIHP